MPAVPPRLTLAGIEQGPRIANLGRGGDNFFASPVTNPTGRVLIAPGPGCAMSWRMASRTTDGLIWVARLPGRCRRFDCVETTITYPLGPASVKRSRPPARIERNAFLIA